MNEMLMQSNLRDKRQATHLYCSSVSSVNMAAPISSSPLTLGRRFLMIFDFDETIINESSDDAVIRAAPGGTIPDHLKASFHPGHYNEHMQRVLAYMAEQGVCKEAIRSAIEVIPAAPGLLALQAFLHLHPQDFECVVISDANTYFIETWLKKAGTRQLFSEIFTNPASFDKDERLVLQPFHSHRCPQCPKNMCKQVILRDYLSLRVRQRGQPFQRVFYTGDGANDICPTKALSERDIVFPRRNFPMHCIIQDMIKKQPGIYKPTVVPWVSGEDIVDYLKKEVRK